MAHTELDLRERRRIEDMLNAKMSVREIAAEIGRHVSTVYRDIKRNGYTDDQLPELNGYYGVVAQRTATQRRARRRKLVRLVDLRKAVIKQLKEGWSPEQIAGRMRLERHPKRVSDERIYRYAYSKDGRAEKLYQHLPRHRRNRRPRGMRKHNGRQSLEKLAIAHRPEAICREGGMRFGHVPQGIWLVQCDLTGRVGQPLCERPQEP